MSALEADRLIESAGGGYWNVLNVGAILLAKQLSDFDRMQRKAVRVVVYKGKGRVRPCGNKPVPKVMRLVLKD